MNRRLAVPTALSAVLALGLVTGGITYAAAQLPANSVTSSTIKNGAVKAKDLRDGAVTSAKVKDGTLTGADVEDSSLMSADVADGTLTGADIDETTLAIPAKAGTLVLTGRDFHVRQSTSTWTTTTGGEVFLTAGADYVPAELPLPAGATITGTQVFVIDNGASAITAVLSRYEANALGVADFNFVDSVGASNAVQTINLPTVLTPTGNQRVVINVFLPLTNSYRLLGARVSYTYDAALRPSQPVAGSRSTLP